MVVPNSSPTASPPPTAIERRSSVAVVLIGEILRLGDDVLRVVCVDDDQRRVAGVAPQRRWRSRRPVGRHGRAAFDLLQRLGEGDPAFHGGSAVDVTVGGGGDDHDLVAACDEAVLRLAGAVALRRGIFEALVLHHTEGSGAEHSGNDDEERCERQHQPVVPYGESAESGEQTRWVHQGVLSPGRSDHRHVSSVRPRGVRSHRATARSHGGRVAAGAGTTPYRSTGCGATNVRWQ